MQESQISEKARVGPRTPNSEKVRIHAGIQPIAALQNVAILNQYPRHETLRSPSEMGAPISRSLRLSDNLAFSGARPREQND